MPPPKGPKGVPAYRNPHQEKLGVFSYPGSIEVGAEYVDVSGGARPPRTMNPRARSTIIPIDRSPRPLAERAIDPNPSPPRPTSHPVPPGPDEPSPNQGR